MNIQNRDDFEPIAIIGLGCRLPGAASPDALWNLLERGGDAIGALDPERARGLGPVGRREVLGGFLEHVDRFDARFFGISPREAERVDPQQRILLEVAWEALEDAGLTVERLDGNNASVFVGMWINDYEARMFAESARVDFHMTTGSGRYTASGRLSHLLRLRGPSVTIDTACSSSLVAVHLACQSLWSGEAALALAAGVNVILQPHITAAYSESGMLSRDGRCKFGDARADGYVRSEGVGVVVLKPLSQARVDRDRVHAVILGTAVNNDGHTGGSLGTPGRAGQEDLLRTAYHRARIAPAAVQYIEAHGTGTRAGDPVELAALGAVVGTGRDVNRPCFVGSVKTNIGHTEGAAGLAGLIKVVLSLEHRIIPASLHFETPTPEVAWDELPLAIPTEALVWPGADRPVAGVSSFGIGGTNAHAVLAAAPSSAASPADDGVERESLLVLSARSSEALRGLAESYCERLARPDLPALSDVCYTAAVRRSHHEHRLAVVGRDPQEITARLQSFLKTSAAGLARTRADGRNPRVAFVFPGQGSQWVGMGRRLAEKEPAFRKALERCASAIAAQGGPALVEELNFDEPSRLDRIEVVQPALFAIQVALAELWREWGVEPVAVVGHSMGEVAAAHIAGALTLDDAARVISTRSALLRRISGRGAMAMVEISPHELGALLRGRESQLSIAVCNSPRSTVVAGDVDALEALIGQLGRDGVLCRRVKVDVASHSSQVEPLRDDLLRGLTGLTPVPSRVPMYSTVTGAPIDGAQLDAGYWIRNLREPVKFSTAVQRLLEDECDVFIEISPHPILLAAIEQNAGAGRSGLFLPSLRRQEPERAVMLESLGALYGHGYAVDWARLYPSGGNCVGLPSYAWERVRFWYPGSPTGRRPLGAGGHPWFEEHVASSADPGTHFWQGRTDPARVPWLMEYRVGGVARLPASAIVEMALAAGRTLFGAGGCRAEDLRLESPLVVSEAAPRTMQLMVSTSLPGSGSFRLASRDAEAQASARWTVHATGTIRTDPTEDGTSPLMMEPVVMADASPGEDHYEAMRRRGLDYGPSFQGIVETARRGPLTFVHVRATETVRRETDQYEIHPCLLDACLQAVVAALDGSTRGENTAYVPAGIGRVILHGPSGGSDLWCRVAFREEAQDGEVVADVVVADDTDQMLIEVTGVCLVPIARQSGDDLAHQGFEIVWRPKRRLAGARPRGSGRWVILADRRGVGEGLAAKLVARGSRCSLIFGRGAQVESGRNGTAIDPTSPGEYEALVASEGTEPIEGVVHLWGLDTPPLDLAPQAAETITEALAIQGLVHLVRALVASGAARSPRIVLATAGTQEAAGGPGRLAIEQAPLWGVGAVIASEYPDLHCVRVDLSSEPTVEEIEGLAEECREPDGEGQIALRGPSRYVARLVRVLPSTTDHVEEHRSTPAGDTPFRLHTSATGALDGLHFRPLQRRAPGPGEVEIEVHAAGLNFRDVMSALGSLPGHPDGIGTIGMECSGRVVAVGGMVETVSRGDEVVAIAFDSLSTHVVADARLVARKPIALSHQVAATLPIAFVAAWYALHTLAQMRPGERVLIHAATGGVGLAAVQLARKAGARVFATAGSAGKHEFLRTLGVEQVFDSRSLSFADNVRACTGGEGVDVVLNSLAGPAITAGLTALAPYGRFVELGMRDIHQNSLLGLGPFRRNLSYAALDLMQMCRERPGVVGALLADMMQRFSNGDLAPLPVRVFQIGEVKEAFRCMAEARHIGKIALSLLPEEARVAPLVGAPDTVCAEATYLITGGLGALGLTVARALVDAGARHVALIGRRAPGEAARRAIAELTRRGVDVVTMEADVTSPERMVEVLETLRREKPPLRGVIHAAGVLEDATLRRLTRDQIRKVMAPKAAGAFMLHVLTQGDPLDFFVLFSSASAFLGLGGQANYGGANAFLDALARHRHRLGQTALSIGWGPWSDIGLAAASDERGMRLEAMGLGSLTPRQGVEAFRQMLGSSHVHVAVMEFDATAWCAERGNDADVFLGELTAPTPATDGREGAQSLAEALRVAPATTRADMLLRHVREQVATVLRFAEPEAIDAARGFFTLGMDSLMAIELKNRLQASLERPLPSTVVFDRPSITQLAGYVGREILGWGASSIASGVPEPDSVDAEEIRRLSRHELQGLLAEELKQLKDLG